MMPSLLSMYAGVGVAFLVILLSLLALGFVLYYFTGDKKKADEFMPVIMSQSSRVFSYFWMLIISIVAYSSTYAILYYVFGNILPKAERYGVDVEAITLVQGIIVALLMGVMFYAVWQFSEYTAKVSGVKGTVSKKLFLTAGLVIFSVIFFTATIGTFTNVIEYFYDADGGVDAGMVASMFGSLGFMLAYGFKVIQTLGAEKK